MFEFSKEKFNNNSKFIALILIALIVIIISTTIINITSNPIILENDLESSGTETINKLIINEIANNNDGSYADSNGQIYDWVEIYNGTEKDIDLDNYSLSDDPSKIKWSFKNLTIKSKEYIVIFLAKEKKEGLYANFGLSKNGGERLVLRNSRGKVIDMVDTLKTNKNTSMARDLEGKWQIVKQVTPGFINTLEGYNAYLSSLEQISEDLLINEVLVRNGGQFKDNYNEYSGYIELKNTTKNTIKLSEYSLSNNVEEPMKWQLPEIYLNPNEIIMIYTSGRDSIIDTLHTNFKLNSKNGIVILSQNGKIVQKVEYANLANGYALVYSNGSYLKTGVLSGGFENNHDGEIKFAEKYQKNQKTLVINEVMNNNYSYLPQNSGNYYDWIELKNNSSEKINLSNYYLTTTLNDTEMYQLPNIELEPNAIYLVMASGDTNLSNNSYKHTNFKISNAESIYITSNNKVIDSIFVSSVPNGYSYGRNENYGFIYMERPTPYANNNGGNYNVSIAPELSVTSGVYNNVENITLEIIAPGNIFYTLNGDKPSSSSIRYTGPITLNKTTVIRVINIEDGKIASNVTTGSYIINENHTLPVMSVAIDNSSFKTINRNSWKDIEEEAYASLFEDGKGFNIPCGFKLFGGSTRSLNKKSFTLKFKKKYGESKLNYQVFENRDNSIYNSLVLRSGSQDYNVSLIRDPVLTSIIDETSVDVQAMKPVILYINGSYWGIYYLDEKVDEDFVAAHYNIKPDQTNMMVITGENITGDRSGYDEFMRFLKTHDMSKQENYDYIKTVFNIDNLIEFWIAETYITNNDIINCKFFSNPNYDDGKWHFIFFDLDFGMYHPGVNYYTIMTNPSGMGSMNIDSTITSKLFKNAEFRNRFVEKLKDMLKTTLSDENIIKKINYYHDLLEPEMARNTARWGSNVNAWESEVEKLRNFVYKRRYYLLNQTKSFFKLSNEEMSAFYD